MLYEKSFFDGNYEEAHDCLIKHKNKYTGLVVDQICNTGRQFYECPLILSSERYFIMFYWYQYTGKLMLTVYGRDEFEKCTKNDIFRDPRWEANEFIYINAPYAEEIHAPIRNIRLRHERWAGRRILKAIEVNFGTNTLQIFRDETVIDMMDSYLVLSDGN